MTKPELITAVQAQSGLDITKAAVEGVIDALTGVIAAAVKRGEDVRLVDFGTFKLVERKAKTGRNPATGATIKIAASRSMKFSIAGPLKKSFNGKK